MDVKVIATDIDGVLDMPILSDFFQISIPLWQKVGIKVGILTSRPESDKQIVAKVLEKCKLKMDFLAFMPDEFKNQNLPPGVWKGVLCRLMKVDILYDDFQRDNPQFVADFVGIARDTQVLNPLSYNTLPDSNDKTSYDYAEQLIEALQGKIIY